MKLLISEVMFFLKNKVYIAIIGLTAVCSYGFMISHQTIGVDDTATLLYFKEGLAPAIGRWSLYLLNKVFYLSDFSPWMVELVSILIFILSVTLWCVLFRRILGDKISIWGYAIFAGIFLSCPIHSEVFVYYLHNGICLGYGVIALSLITVLSCMRRGTSSRAVVNRFFLAVLGIVVSIGFYESFLIVYAVGTVMLFYLIHLVHDGAEEDLRYQDKVLPWIGILGLTGVLAVILRSICLMILKWLFGFEIPENFIVTYRSIFQVSYANFSDLFMLLKKFWVLYYVNAFVYLPIAILVTAMTVITFYAVKHALCWKNGMPLLGAVAIAVIPVSMAVVEGYPTRYRTGQYVPLVCAFAVLLLFWEWNKHIYPRWMSYAAIMSLIVLLYNQCADMNKWFYIDYLKYEDAMNTMNQVAYELEKNYNTSKPIIFRGVYRVPYEIVRPAYCSFSSDEYKWICRVTDIVDVHLKEKFFAEDGRGYVFVETPVYSTLQWGITAFDNTSWQLIEFWKMHGYEFRAETDLNKIKDADKLREGMPGFPRQGSIVECDEYIIVNFGW